MTTIVDAFKAGIDAVIADPTINRSAFVDAVQTVITQRLSNQEGNDWVDAIAVEYNRLGIINQPTYNRLRNHIESEGADVANELFIALQAVITLLPESAEPISAVRIMDLRNERDEINTSIATMQGFQTGATAQVREALRQGIESLRQHRENVRAQLRGLIGDPDA